MSPLALIFFPSFPQIAFDCKFREEREKNRRPLSPRAEDPSFQKLLFSPSLPSAQQSDVRCDFHTYTQTKGNHVVGRPKKSCIGGGLDRQGTRFGHLAIYCLPLHFLQSVEDWGRGKWRKREKLESGEKEGGERERRPSIDKEETRN